MIILLHVYDQFVQTQRYCFICPRDCIFLSIKKLVLTTQEKMMDK